MSLSSPNKLNHAGAEPGHRPGHWSRAVALVFRATALFGVACLLGAALVTVVDIGLRFFDAAIPGVVDIVQLLVLATGFAAIPFAFHRDAHVSVDLFSQVFPQRIQSLLIALASLGGVVLMGLILYYGWEAAKMQMMFGDVSQNIRIPMIWYWIPLLVGSALSVLAAVLATLQNLAGLFRSSRRSA